MHSGRNGPRQTKQVFIRSAWKGLDLESEVQKVMVTTAVASLPFHPNLPTLNAQAFQNHVSKNQPFISV